MQAHVWQKIMFTYDVIAIFLTITCFNSPHKRGYDITYVAKAYDICFRFVTSLYRCTIIHNTEFFAFVTNHSTVLRFSIGKLSYDWLKVD
jgi:hypothetical protein